MPQLQPIVKTNLHRGMSAAADYLAPDGFIRDGENLRFHRESGLMRRNRTKFKKTLAGVDPSNTYAYGELDSYLIMVGDDAATGTNVQPFVFDGDGAACTIQKTGTLTFSGGSDATGTPQGFEVGDTIDPGATGIEAVIVAVIPDRGISDSEWSAGTASGKLRIRVTLGTWPTGTGSIVNQTDGTVSASQDSYDEVDFSYLGSDMTAIRIFSIEKSVIIWNTGTTVAMQAAPGTTADIDGDVLSFDNLTRRFGASIGDVFETLSSEAGFPAGFYECTATGDKDTREAPQWNRVPKPGQDDAAFDLTTMPHRLLKVDSTTFAWEQIQWEPRLSGGDVVGTNPVTGEDVILNPPILKDQKIIDLDVFAGKLAILTDDKKRLLSRSGDFFNLWVDDVRNPKADDSILAEVIGRNVGESQFIVPVGSNLWTQMDHRQFQYGAGDQVLVAGGEGTPRNGRDRKRGDFEANGSVAPVASGEFLFMIDQNRNLIAWRDDGVDLRLAGIISDPIYQDLSEITPVRLAFVNRSLYLIDDDGVAWSFRIHDFDDRGALIGAWNKTLVMEEQVVYLWGVGSSIHLLTRDSIEFTLLTWTDEDQPADAGFEIVERIDRYEDVTGTYDSSTDETTFSVNTTYTTSDCELHIRGDISKLIFDAGNYQPTAGDAILGITSGAAGTILRFQTISGTAGGGDLKGRIWINRSNYSTPFQDNELLTIAGTARTNAVDGEEEEVAIKGEIKSPASVDTSGDVVFAGFWGGMDHRIGRPFTSKAKFHRFYPGLSRKGLLIKDVTIMHERTTDYQIRIARDGRSTDKVFQFTSKQIGEYRHGSAGVETGIYTIDAGGEARAVDLTIESSSSGPFRIGAIILDTEIES